MKASQESGYAPLPPQSEVLLSVALGEDFCRLTLLARDVEGMIIPDGSQSAV